MKFKAKFLQRIAKYDLGQQGIGSSADHAPDCSGCASCIGQPTTEGKVFLPEVSAGEDK